MNHAEHAHLTRARSLATLLTLLVGVPAILTWAGGSPLPPYGDVRHAVENTATDILVLRVVIAGCWLLWTQFAACVVVEALAAGRGRPVGPPVPLAGPAQHMARRLIATLTVATATASLPTTVALVPAAASQAVAAPHQPVPAPATITRPGSAATPTRTTPTTVTAPRPTPVDRHQLRLYTVRPPYGGHHDTLWGAAERYLGDGARLHEIAALNLGRTMPDGQIFTDQDLIYPGWTLLMPPDAKGLPLAHPAPPPPRPHAPRPERPTPPTSAKPSPSPSLAAPAAPPVASREAETRPASPTVALPTGSVVAASFLAGLAAATAAGRLRRRRHYQPNPPQPAALGGPKPATAPLAAAVAAAGRPVLPENDDDIDLPAAPKDVAGETVAPWLYAGMTDPTPARIPIAHRDGEPVELDLVAAGPLSITGEPALHAARAIIASLLTRGGPFGACAILPAATYDLLLPGVPSHPGITRTADLAEALQHLDVERVARTRRLDREDLPDVTAHRRAHPEEPMPVVLLVTTELGSDAALYDAVLDHSATLGLASLHLGEPLSGHGHVRLDADGSVADVAPPTLAAALAGSRLYTLSPDDASDALARLATAVTDTEAEPDGTPIETAPDNPADPELAPPNTGAPIHIQMLGSYTINARGAVIRTGMRNGRELLAYALLNPGATTMDRIVETLWPDTPARRADERFWNALRALRRCLRDASGISDLDVLDWDGERYQLNRDHIDTDLWYFQAALAAARDATDAEIQLAALQAAVEHYEGNLLEDYAYDWLETDRQELRRRALDALSRIADLHVAAGDSARALGALERALAFDPVAETFYQRAMRLHIDGGARDAAARLYRRLESELHKLDLEPMDETQAILVGTGQVRSAQHVGG